MKHILIHRVKDTGKQFLGLGMVIDGLKKVFDFNTLELSWRQNERNISCIPFGTYKVSKRTSSKFGLHFYIHDIYNRDFILIHVGNYHTDIKGCILVGKSNSFYDLNKDGQLDVISSGATMRKLLDIMPNYFELKIV